MWRKEKMKKVTGIITTIKRRPKFSTQQCLLRKKTSWITTIMAKTKRFDIRIQIKAAFIGGHLLHAHILSTMIIKIGKSIMAIPHFKMWLLPSSTPNTPTMTRR